MIVDKSINIKITKKNFEHFKKYYDSINLGDFIDVDPNQLQESSNIRINVECDICNIQRNIKFQAYNKNINSCKELKIYTCDKCSHIKIKKTNLEKWGREYFSQTDEYLEKFKKTMLERWGVEHALQSEELKEKVRKTNLVKFGFENVFMDKGKIKNSYFEKFGVCHPSKSEPIRNKISETYISKFGSRSPLSNYEIRKKIENTNLEKWGGHPMKNPSNLSKMIRTNLKKWGHEFTFSSNEVKDKIKKSNLEKFGVENPMMSEEVRKGFIVTNHPNYIKYLGSSYSLFLCEFGHEFSIHIDNFNSRSKNKIKLCTVCNPIGDSRSIKELELFNYIKSIYLGEIIQSYRDGLEIDIYLPELKLGFEFNGLYWHSEIKKDKNYHLNKTKYFSDRGIRLIHIWEDDWDNKRIILESQIKNWIGISDGKIFARKCKIIQLDSVSKFLNENHIQGSDKSSIKLGLEYGGEIVSVMTFNNLEGRKKMGEGEWNLSRFCNKLGHNVIGGASKLLSHFIKEFNPTRIISYAEKYWSKGDLYYKLGFNLVDSTRPDYKYIVGSTRVHKSNFRKSKIKYSCSESEFTDFRGINKIWDCGKLKFEKIIKNS